ncbi:hypothetical protein QUB05_15275 [Microcoleus sp. F10-C6]
MRGFRFLTIIGLEATDALRLRLKKAHGEQGQKYAIDASVLN